MVSRCECKLRKDTKMCIQSWIAIDCRFIYVDCGSNGRMSDGGVWHDCQLAKVINDQTPRLPLPEELPGAMNLVKVHHHLVGDEAFPQKVYLQKPILRQNKNREKQIFNYRFSQARQVIGN